MKLMTDQDPCNCDQALRLIAILEVFLDLADDHALGPMWDDPCEGGCECCICDARAAVTDALAAEAKG